MKKQSEVIIICDMCGAKRKQSDGMYGSYLNMKLNYTHVCSTHEYDKREYDFCPKCTIRIDKEIEIFIKQGGKIG